jgi:hypothetical protein
MGMDSDGLLAASTSGHVVAGGPLILLAVAIIGLVIYLAVSRGRK